MTTQEKQKIEDHFYSVTRKMSQAGWAWNLAKQSAINSIYAEFGPTLAEQYLNQR